MKRIFACVCVLITAFFVFPSHAAVSNANGDDVHFVYQDNGDYLVIETHTLETREVGSRTEGKTYTYYNSLDVAEWVMTLTGSFTYDGTTSACTSSECTVTIFDDSGWELISKSATKSGNTAYAEATFAMKVLGITVSRPTYNITITCDKDGNVM